MYVDGHECPDVQKYRTEFLAVISSGECRRTTFNDETLEPIQPILKPGEKKHIPVHHDESIFRSNELRQRIWVKDGKMPLGRKGQGKAIYVSDFITEETGRLSLLQEQVLVVPFFTCSHL